MKLVQTLFQSAVLFSSLMPQLLLSHEQEKKACEQENSCQFANPFPQVVYPPNAHFLASVSALGDWVELRDGSIWEVTNGIIARNWHTSDHLMLTQNDQGLSSYNYQIVNMDTGELIEANFFSLNQKGCNRCIKEISLESSTLKMNDNSSWEVFAEDLDKIADWELSDAIVFGVNGGPKKSVFGALLINPRLGDRVRARQK